MTSHDFGLLAVLAGVVLSIVGAAVLWDALVMLVGGGVLVFVAVVAMVDLDRWEG